MRTTKVRLAAFGLRSLPPTKGSAGSETYASELYSRLAARGFEITAYCRVYPGTPPPTLTRFKGIKLVHLRTFGMSGFDTLFHSLISTAHCIARNTGDVVHIHNGGNSIWAVPLRIFGKRVIVTQDGVDWKREKWKWYARFFLRLSMFFTAYAPNQTVFDNVFARDAFERRFRRRYLFIPHGSDCQEPERLDSLGKYGLRPQEYFLFVGRFVPDKGVHLLVKAFEQVFAEKKLVIVGGSPNPGSDYEARLRATEDARIQFPGFVYGDDVLQLVKGSYCYVQPSDFEGMSPIILTAMGVGSPVICSNIPENAYIVGETALLFERGNVQSLAEALRQALSGADSLRQLGLQGQRRARGLFMWDNIAALYDDVFRGNRQMTMRAGTLLGDRPPTNAVVTDGAGQP